MCPENRLFAIFFQKARSISFLLAEYRVKAFGDKKPVGIKIQFVLPPFLPSTEDTGAERQVEMKNYDCCKQPFI